MDAKLVASVKPSVVLRASMKRRSSLLSSMTGGIDASAEREDADTPLRLLKHAFGSTRLKSIASKSLRFTSTDMMQEVRSEEHTSELQSLMRISYDVFCLKNKNQTHTYTETT